MKIINRIMISSAFLVLLSLVSLLAVISIMIFLFHDDPGKEILDKDVFHAGEILDGFDASTRHWDALNARLSLYGYKLLVLEDDNVVFSTLSDSQGRIINSLKPLELGQSALAGALQEQTFAVVADEAYFRVLAGFRFKKLVA